MATPSQLIAIYGETLVGVSAADQEAPRVFARVKRQNQRLVNRTLTRAGFPTAGVPLETGAEGGPVSAIGGGSATAIGVTASATCGGSGSAIGTADDQSDSSEGFSHTFQEGIHASWNRHDARFYREGDGRDSSPRIWNSPAAPLRDERDMSPVRGIPPTHETLQKHADIQALEEFKEFPATQMEPASGRRSRSRSPSQAQISSGDSQMSRMPGDPSPSEEYPSSLPRRLASAAPREKSSQPLAAATEKNEEEPSDHDTMPQTKKEEDDDNTQPQQTKKEAVQVDATRPDALEQAQIAAVIAASLIEVGSIDLVPDAPQREAAPEQPDHATHFVAPTGVPTRARKLKAGEEYQWQAHELPLGIIAGTSFGIRVSSFSEPSPPRPRRKCEYDTEQPPQTKQEAHDHDTLPQTKKEEHDTQPPQTNEEQHEHDTLSQTKKDGGEGKPAIGGKDKPANDEVGQEGQQWHA